MRRPGPVPSRSLGVLCAAVLLGTSVSCGSNSAPAPASAPPCQQAGAPEGEAMLASYAAAGPLSARQLSMAGRPASVSVALPRVELTGSGISSTLPVGPCQHIYRFAHPEIVVGAGEDAGPFASVEVDWNTEGAPRGPNGSFTSAHFDVHLFVQPRATVVADMGCVTSNGKTCDPLKENYAQMRRFLQLPEARFVPDGYHADIDSSIPEMGLHLLDMRATYTVAAVDHTPVLIYGTFDGAVVFAEASVTLVTLHDAAVAPDHRVTFPFRQPAELAAAGYWPTSFTVEHVPATGGFVVTFGDMAHHEAAPA